MRKPDADGAHDGSAEDAGKAGEGRGKESAEVDLTGVKWVALDCLALPLTYPSSPGQGWLYWHPHARL